MSLPASWVEALFDRMAVRYGAAFTRQYEGLDMAAVRTDWALQLAGFADKPKAIAYALDHLPTDFPPNVMQFREAARRGIVERTALPAPSVDRDGLKRIAGELERIVKRAPDQRTPRQQLIDRLRAIESSGRKLTPAQHETLRVCEGAFDGGHVSEVGGGFKPIPLSVWPAGMRADREAAIAASGKAVL